MKAHQREIREEMEAFDPRERVGSLDGYMIETISRHDATPLILDYEWLGNIGRATIFVGLVSPRRTLEGVAAFGYGPAGNIRHKIGSPAYCLERGACVHYAPSNAASFLINRACKLVYRLKEVPIFFAYADPSAGEYGGVYQAAGWVYLGQGLDGSKNRQSRISVLRPGRDPNNAAHWQTTRELRRRDQRLSLKQLKDLGWKVGYRPAKYVYATHVGRDRRKWLKQWVKQTYPAPEIELKRRYNKSETFRITSPPKPIDMFDDSIAQIEMARKSYGGY